MTLNDIKKKLYNHRRKLFGRYEIDDPRPIAKSAPYTFYMPSEEKLKAIEEGDIVKLIFRSIPTGWEWDAERMWVQVTEINAPNVKGKLDNDPFDMPQMQAGDIIEFKLWNVIDIQFSDPEKEKLFAGKSTPGYWGRCLVDSCVIDRNVSVDYIYREYPDLAGEDDKYPDSGWRIRADPDEMTDEEYDNHTPHYIALAKVLNVDDSWIDLINSPIGSRFLKNKETGLFEEDLETD